MLKETIINQAKAISKNSILPFGLYGETDEYLRDSTTDLHALRILYKIFDRATFRLRARFDTD